MHTLEEIDSQKLPRHIAIIMDGNGRWARQKGKLRVFGHENVARLSSILNSTMAILKIAVLTTLLFAVLASSVLYLVV